MSFPEFPAAAFVNGLGDAGLTYIGLSGEFPIEGILSIDEGIDPDGSFSVAVEFVTLDMLETEADKIEKNGIVTNGPAEFMVLVKRPPDMGMVEVILERISK